MQRRLFQLKIHRPGQRGWGNRANYITLNAVISTGGGGASYLPGSAAGSTLTGGQYQ